jgi:hypothetical protein
MKSSFTKVIYGLVIIVLQFTASAAWAAEFQERHLLIIDGVSGMGKSSTADALKVWFERSTNKILMRSSIDYFFQSEMYADSIKILDSYLFEDVYDWDTLFANIRRLGIVRNSIASSVLEFSPYIKNFFTTIRLMMPSEVKRSCFDAENEFYADIKTSLGKADVVIVDHNICLYGAQKWQTFLQSLSKDVHVTHITLTCDYVHYVERNKMRNSSKNVAEHRFMIAEDIFNRQKAKNEQTRAYLLAGTQRIYIDSSTMSLEEVIEAILPKAMAQEDPLHGRESLTGND